MSFPNIHYLRAEQPHQSDADLMAHFEGVIEGVIEGVGKDIKRETGVNSLCPKRATWALDNNAK